MICPREDALSRRHDGELKGEELQQLEAHLAGCAVCREFESKLRTLDQLLTAPIAMTSGAFAAGQRKRGQSRQRRTTVWFAAASLAATLAVFGVAARVQPAPSPDGGVVTYQVASPQGGTYHITVEGEAQLLSIEVNGTVARFPQETSP
jgi:anti-sigma factor RsiW